MVNEAGGLTLSHIMVHSIAADCDSLKSKSIAQFAHQRGATFVGKPQITDDEIEGVGGGEV